MDIQIEDAIYSVHHKEIAGPRAARIGHFGLTPIGQPFVIVRHGRQRIDELSEEGNADKQKE